VPGPYKITSEGAFGSPGHRVFRPTTLDAFPKKDTLPLMVWGNGGCAIDSARYSGFLTTIASHGFLVLGTAAQEGAARRDGRQPQTTCAPRSPGPSKKMHEPARR
jgi:hypothetical protein